MVEGHPKTAFKGVAGTTPQSMARWDEGGGRDGQVHRVQDRRQRETPDRNDSDGPIPHRPPRQGRPGPIPAPRPTRTPQAPQPGRRSPVPGPPHPPHQHRTTDRATTNPPSRRCSPTITNVEVKATWHIYQQMIATYRESNPTTGKTRTESLITKLTHAVPACLTEAATLGRTLKKRAADILTFLRPPRHQQRPHRNHQRPPRTPPRPHTRLPQPHPLHHPSTPRDRRLQTSPTPSIVKSPITAAPTTPSKPQYKPSPDSSSPTPYE